MLIALTGAVLGILFEAFLPRRVRYPAQVGLALLTIGGALVWTLVGANRVTSGSRSPALSRWTRRPM